MQLTGLYADFVAVLRSVPQGEAVLSEKLLPHDSRSVAVSDVLSVNGELSIDEKFASGGFYDADPYGLFHDLKLAFGRYIAQFPQNSSEYDDLARLFKFAADLLVREASRLGFTGDRRPETDTNDTYEANKAREVSNEVSNEASAGTGPGTGAETSAGVSVGASGASVGASGASVGASGASAGASAETSVTGAETGISGPSGLANDSVSASVSSGDVGSAWNDEYLQQISRGFQTISTELQAWNGETYWVTAANGPLFMSNTNKAPMDPRDTIVSGSVHTVKLLPHLARAPESTLGFVSPLNPRVPQPDTTPTDLLSRFIHPNAHATFSPLWLQGQDPYGSFAPTSDSAGAVVGEEDAASVWADKASRPKTDANTSTPATPTPTTPSTANAEAAPDTDTAKLDVKPESSDPTKPDPAGDSAMPDSIRQGSIGPDSQDSAMPDSAIPDSAMPDSMPDSIGQDSASSPAKIPADFSSGMSPGLSTAGALAKPEPVATSATSVGLSSADLEALMRWTPSSFVDDDELEAAQQGRAAEHELLSRLLLELQYLQNERLAAPGTGLEVSDKERHVALKSGNLLARLVGDGLHDEFALQLDTRLPVLMRNYAGSLPAATDPAMQAPIRTFDGPMAPQAPQSQRLQTLASLRTRPRSRR